MNLTLINRIKLCWEILTTRCAQEKQLSTFMHGYMAGANDIWFEIESVYPWLSRSKHYGDVICVNVCNTRGVNQHE